MRRSIREVSSGNIHFADQNSASYGHSDGYHGQINVCELPPSNKYIFTSQILTPRDTRQRGREGYTERAVVDPQRHGIDSAPPSAIGYRVWRQPC